MTRPCYRIHPHCGARPRAASRSKTGQSRFTLLNVSKGTSEQSPLIRPNEADLLHTPLAVATPNTCPPKPFQHHRRHNINRPKPAQKCVPPSPRLTPLGEYSRIVDHELTSRHLSAAAKSRFAAPGSPKSAATAQARRPKPSISPTTSAAGPPLRQ